ncbi:hypothetical protein BdWA1_000781 [Babesia duncani]|uniref:Uncharacterized protein n=1 Tax=Babesia duncani TaxID=323732 RepID=A0AAD9PN07_9APIC|nr:hypothetical protein BdWA1_000781 [Babesia duncani]
MLLKFGLTTEPDGHCTFVSRVIMKFLLYIRYQYGLRIVNVLSWFGGKFAVLLKGTDNGMVMTLRHIPWIGGIVMDASGSTLVTTPFRRFKSFFFRLFTWRAFEPSCYSEFKAIFALMVIVRLFYIGLGIFCNLVQMQHYCLLLNEIQASLAIALNFAVQFVLAGLVDICTGGSTLSWSWVMGSSLVVAGAALVILEEDQKQQKQQRIGPTPPQHVPTPRPSSRAK